MIDKFRLLIENFSEFWILCTAVELDIFERINKGSGSIYEVAENWHRETVEALCNCLVAYNYLEKSGNEYKLTEESKKYLLKDSPDYIGYFAESARVFDILSKFTSFIVEGERIEINNSGWEIVTKMSAILGKELPEFLFERIPILKTNCSILDLGCGRMRESITMAELNPQLNVVGVESNSKIIEDAYKEIRKKNLSDRVVIKKEKLADFSTEKTFDVVFLNHIIHCLPHEINIALLKNIRNWTKPSGSVVIFDDLLDDNKTSPKESVKKNLLTKIFNSKIYSESELNELLHNSGFKEIEKYKYQKRRILVIGKSI